MRRSKQQHLKIKFILLTGFTFLLLLACSDAAKKTAPKAPTVPFAVTQTSPGHEAREIPLNAVLTVSFSKEVDGTSFNEQNVEIRRQNDDTEVLRETRYSNRLGIIKPNQLVSNTGYRVVVNTNVKDVDGQSLAKQHSWSFTTGDQEDRSPPTVYLNEPQNTDIPTNTDLIIGFNEIIDRGSVSIALNGTDIVTNGQAVSPATIRFDQSRISIKPGELQPETTYTIEVKNTLTDLAGNALADNFSWQFTTSAAPDTEAPAITGSTPGNGAKDLLRDVRFSIGVSEALNAATVNSEAVYLLQSGDNPALIPVRVDLSGENTIKVYPQTYLAFNETYFITFDGVTDKAGNALSLTEPLTYTIETDSDNDGMPDRWENLYTGLDPNVNDANADEDLAADGSSDGLTNVEEFDFGSNPTLYDTDGDGVNDGDEKAANRNPNVNENVVMTIINQLILSE